MLPSKVILMLKISSNRHIDKLYNIIKLLISSIQKCCIEAFNIFTLQTINRFQVYAEKYRNKYDHPCTRYIFIKYRIFINLTRQTWCVYVPMLFHRNDVVIAPDLFAFKMSYLPIKNRFRLAIGFAGFNLKIL